MQVSDVRVSNELVWLVWFNEASMEVNHHSMSEWVAFYGGPLS